MDDLTTDASTDAAPAFSEATIQKQMQAAEFFETYERRREAEETQDRLTALGAGAVIGLVIVLVIRLRRTP